MKTFEIDPVQIYSSLPNNARLLCMINDGPRSRFPKQNVHVWFVLSECENALLFDTVNFVSAVDMNAPDESLHMLLFYLLFS
jgi:hypothetical protein